MDTDGHQSPERPRDDFRGFTFERTAVAKAAAALLAETPAGVGR
jgi:hypothetical protein